MARGAHLLRNLGEVSQQQPPRSSQQVEFLHSHCQRKPPLSSLAATPPTPFVLQLSRRGKSRVRTRGARRIHAAIGRRREKRAGALGLHIGGAHPPAVNRKRMKSQEGGWCKPPSTRPFMLYYRLARSFFFPCRLITMGWSLYSGLEIPVK